jgi:YD repeat-containing protein
VVLTQPRGSTSLAYQPTTGQLTTVIAPDGGTLAYTYDGALVTSETWGGPAGAVAGRASWSYDSDFQVASESVNGATPPARALRGNALIVTACAMTERRRRGQA